MKEPIDPQLVRWQESHTGCGSVKNSTEVDAIENIKRFIVDSKVNGVSWVRISEKDYGKGRYAFLLWKDNFCCEIQMPGISLEKVRYLDNGKQNIWNYPRLYVNGSSWVWKYAIDIFKISFENEET